MEQDIRFNSGALSPTECISQGWELIKDNYGLFLGISLVGMIIGGCIPCVSLFLAGPIAVGMFYCLFRQYRGENVEFGMMFKGFDVIVPAMVIGIIQAIPEIVGQGFRFSFQLADLFSKSNGRNVDFYQSSSQTALAGGLIAVALIVGVAFFLFAIFWRIAFFFALPLLAEYPELGITEAIKVSFRAGFANWGMMIVLMILEGLVAILGVLALCIGVFFVMPIILAANAIAFRMIFPPRDSGTGMNMPPPPTAFGGNYGVAQ